MAENLASKYRPSTLDEICGQSIIVNIVKNICKSGELSNRNFLFTGPAGTGKTTVSRAISHELNGFNVEPIEIDAASHSGADAMRDITDQARSYPVGSNYKIFIIDECHSISSTGWQVLLKTLEEQPAKSVFMLCLDGDGYVPTVFGIKRLKDISENDYVWDGHSYKKVLGHYNKGTQKCVSVNFSSGNSIECTPDHRIKVLRCDEEVWVKAIDIVPGDTILTYSNVSTRGWDNNDVSLCEAFFLGYLTGNGNYDNHSMHLYTPPHKWIRLEKVLNELIAEGIIKDYVKQSDLKQNWNVLVTRIHFNHGSMNKWYMKTGCDPSYTRGTKSIPKSVYSMSSDQFRAFVDGWYFADGCGRSDTFFTNTIGQYSPYLYCSSRSMMKDLFQLLQCHGYSPSLRTSISKGEQTPGRELPHKLVTSYTIYLRKRPGYFNNLELRDKLIDKYDKMSSGKYKLDLANLKSHCDRRISPKMLCEAGYSDLVDRGYFETVISVTPSYERDVYDIEVEGSHQFIYNGVCVHNCTTNPEKIPPTIISRVQTFQLSKLPLDTIHDRLLYIIDKENSEGRNITYSDDAIMYIAKLANGGMRDSITLLDKTLAYSKDITINVLEQALGLPDYDDYFELLNAIAKKDNQKIIEVINNVYNSGSNFIKWFDGFFSFTINITKYIYMQDISKTMIPSTYQDKIKNYSTAHAALCLKLSSLLSTMIDKLKGTQYLQEVAISYLCTPPRK